MAALEARGGSPPGARCDAGLPGRARPADGARLQSPTPECQWRRRHGWWHGTTVSGDVRLCRPRRGSLHFWAEVLGYEVQSPPEGLRLVARGARGVRGARVGVELPLGDPARRRRRAARVLPAGSRGQVGQEPRPPRRPGRLGAARRRTDGSAREPRRIASRALGATRAYRVEPAPPMEFGFITRARPRGQAGARPRPTRWSAAWRQLRASRPRPCGAGCIAPHGSRRAATSAQAAVSQRPWARSESGARPRVDRSGPDRIGRLRSRGVSIRPGRAWATGRRDDEPRPIATRSPASSDTAVARSAIPAGR